MFAQVLINSGHCGNVVVRSHQQLLLVLSLSTHRIDLRSVIKRHRYLDIPGFQTRLALLGPERPLLVESARLKVEDRQRVEASWTIYLTYGGMKTGTGFFGLGNRTEQYSVLLAIQAPSFRRVCPENQHPACTETHHRLVFACAVACFSFVRKACLCVCVYIYIYIQRSHVHRWYWQNQISTSTTSAYGPA